MGKKVEVKVSFADGEGNGEEVTSDAIPAKGYPNARIVSAKTPCLTDSD